MKDKEIEIIKQLNKRFNSSLTLSSNEFSYYDAFNKKIILEIKIRNKVYKTKQMDRLRNEKEFTKKSCKKRKQKQKAIY